ncbi:MAG: molybdopterin-dependent oxidoreductase [Anaerolineales bacterium]
MNNDPITITLIINGKERALDSAPGQTLLDLLREFHYWGAKRGCDTGECGVCTVLLDGQPVRSCQLKASAATGHEIITIEGLRPQHELDPIQRAFIETGAIQCGYCTPAQILTTKALLDQKPDPTEAEIREALSGVICRCTGYVRTVEAVQRAAAALRGDTTPITQYEEHRQRGSEDVPSIPAPYRRGDRSRSPLPPYLITPPDLPHLEVVGNATAKIDGPKLAQGRPVFTADISMDGMLYGALLTSPHAHARIRSIDASRARELPGLHAVLTHQDLPRVKYASGGQSFPQPPPFDQVCLDNKVRHQGDRVAVVAAESPELASKAIRLIEVDYEILPAVVDAEAAMSAGAPVIHDEPDTEDVFDPGRNIVHHIEQQVGDVDRAFAEADRVFEGEYRTPKQQQAHLEPHVCLTYWDEDERLVIHTSTQVPFHVRRMVAPLIGLPVKQIRVVKPRIGGGFGNKQEMILEDLCAHLTIATGRPVLMEFNRRQEYTSSRSRHPNIMRYRLGVKDRKLTAAELRLIGDTGAYGCHGLTVQMVGGFKGLTLYNPPNARFICDVVYTNTPPAGAYRGYGAMQCQFGMEVLMEEIAEDLNLDVVEFKSDNWLKVGEPMHLAKKLGEGREGFEQSLKSSGLAQCVDVGITATDYMRKRRQYRHQSDGKVLRGIGMAVSMHGSGIAGLDMAAATLKMNDDGSFNLLLGATDLGTGSDTILAQIAAEVLGVPVEDLIVYSSDTDFTPFDKGAYASSTTYISGGAVRKAAEKIKGQILDHAVVMLELESTDDLRLSDRRVHAPDGRSLSLGEIALSSLHQQDQHQIMATASHMSYQSPPPVGATFAELAVDLKTGQIEVDRLLMAVDCGRVINPRTAAGQVEGGLAQALGFTHCEEMLFDSAGKQLNPQFGDYHVYRSNEMPALDVIFVQTNEPSGPFGAKSVAEIPMDGVAPAMVSALHNATGVWVRELPLTPERVWRALMESEKLKAPMG